MTYFMFLDQLMTETNSFGGRVSIETWRYCYKIYKKLSRRQQDIINNMWR